jgi:hypothetical protein
MFVQVSKNSFYSAAKPLFIGSIPIAASNLFNDLWLIGWQF